MRQRNGLPVLQLGERRGEKMLVMRRVALARAHGLPCGGGPARQQGDVCALAAFGQGVVGLETIAPTAQIRRGSRRELVAGREEQFVRKHWSNVRQLSSPGSAERSELTL